MQENIPVVKSETKIKSRRVGVNIFKTFTYILIFAIGIAAGISVAQQKPGWFGLNQGAAAAQAEVDATVAKVGKLIALPTDEKPTVATVTDASKVNSQPFFQNAKNGDVVLIYTKAQKAILYSPAENKIVEVGAVNINNQALPSTSSITTPTPGAKSK
jgi:hypothetical protein